MKIRLVLILLAAFVSLSASTVVAQRSTSAAQTAAELRAQLGDVIAKETALQTKAEELDEALKPENIERFSQFGGSTRPEEVRDRRRRELNNEKAGVTAQLDLLKTSRARLEAAILTADSLAYQEAARGPAETQVDGIGGLNFQGIPGGRLGVLIGLVALLGFAGLIVFIRRRSHLIQK